MHHFLMKQQFFLKTTLFMSENLACSRKCWIEGIFLISDRDKLEYYPKS